MVLKRIYRFVRKRMPNSAKGNLSRFAYILSGRPRIKRDKIGIAEKFPNKERGGLIISADFEMAWAWRYSKTGADHLKKGQEERNNIPIILEILSRYNIPITFATVGHLFLSSCKRGDHDWMKRIPNFNDHWNFQKGDWYDHDPYSDIQKSPEWYASDLIRMIINAKQNHEIGSHTFSHIDFSYKNCPSVVAEDELKACVMAAEPFGLKLSSMVFPGGTWGNIESLKKCGFKIYRKREKFDLAYPYRDVFGLLVSPSSGPLEYDIRNGWSIDYYAKRLKDILDKAIETGTIAHFWFHPSINTVFLEELFPRVFLYANELRDSGKLWIGTMKDISEHINNNKLL